MRFTEGTIAGAFVIDPEPREDSRGSFARVWCERELASLGLVNRIRQVNTGFSMLAGTLRGMHFQKVPHEEVKIVRCLRGRIFDVVVDLRPASPTHRQWMGVELAAESSRMVYVPEGCAHGYLTMQDATELMYFTSETYAPEAASGVRYDDPAFAIDWPGPVRAISDADRAWAPYTCVDESSVSARNEQ